jgi:hypothetical protein
MVDADDTGRETRLMTDPEPGKAGSSSTDGLSCRRQRSYPGSHRRAILCAQETRIPDRGLLGKLDRLVDFAIDNQDGSDLLDRPAEPGENGDDQPDPLARGVIGRAFAVCQYRNCVCRPKIRFHCYSIVIPLLGPSKFVDRSKNSIDPPSNEFRIQPTDLMLYFLTQTG